MKPFEKFLSESTLLREFLDTYLEIRREFQKIGFSERDLENPPMYTYKIMALYDNLGFLQKRMLKQVKDFGFDIEQNDFFDYLTPLMKKINDLTPLSDVDYKRDDSGDEDN